MTECSLSFEALQENYRTLSLVVNSMRDFAILMLDTDGRVASWSVGAELVMGYKADEVVGKHFSLFFTAEDALAGRPGHELAEARTAGRSEDEGLRVRKDGSRFWADVVITVIHDETGDLAGFAKVTRDVTTRRRAEERKLLAAESHTRAILDAANDAFISIDDAGLITEWNGQAHVLFGWTKSEVLGRPISEIMVPPERRTGDEPGLQNLVAAGPRPLANQRLEFNAVHRSGRRFTVEASFWPTEDDGTSTVNAFLHDITQRCQAEEQLRANEQRLAESQRLAHLGSWEWDIAADRITWSEEQYRIFGVEQGSFEPTYEGYIARLHPDDQEQTMAMIRTALAKGAECALDQRVVKPDGSVAWIHGRIRVDMNADGAPVRIHGTTSDITERVLLQQELAGLALVDELTGLHNRRGFATLADHQLKVAARAGREVPLLFVDMDGMKSINDSFGHVEGDRAIAEVAEFLRSSCRASDVVARVGGDEFCILLIDDGASGAIVDRVATELRAGPPRGDRGYPLSLSVGVARRAPGTGTVQELMDQADSAMYEDKSTQRRKARVLVVEDDPDLRRLAALSLRYRYDVVTVSAGMAALQEASAQLPDLVLLDLGLPDIPGADVLRRLRAMPGGAAVPVIVITAAMGRDAELESLREGVDDFATKPLDLEILEARMENVLQRSRARPRRLSA